MLSAAYYKLNSACKREKLIRNASVTPKQKTKGKIYIYITRQAALTVYKCTCHCKESGLIIQNPSLYYSNIVPTHFLPQDLCDEAISLPGKAQLKVPRVEHPSHASPSLATTADELSVWFTMGRMRCLSHWAMTFEIKMNKIFCMLFSLQHSILSSSGAYCINFAVLDYLVNFSKDIDLP